MTSKELVESYIPMAKFIATVFGPRCEVILHCLDDMEHSIISVENGHITGRSIGGCITDFALKALFGEEKENENKIFVANYPGKTSLGNKTLRSSTFYIRDQQSKIVGLLCINIDITEMHKIKEIIDSELFMSASTDLVDDRDECEQFSLSVDDMVDSIFNQTMVETGYTDPAHMLKNEKQEFIARLNEKNLFALKGVVNIVARKLAISEPTVYRYLQEIK